MVVNLKFDGKTLYAIALHIIILVLCVELYILIDQNKGLKERENFYLAGRLKEGDSFSVDSLDAATATRGYPVEDKGRQLIFVFSTKCRFCMANMKAWQYVASKAKERNLTVYAVSMDSLAMTRSYIAQNGFVNYDVYVPIDIARFARKNRIGGVPITVIRSRFGNVESFWQGTLERKQITEIVSKIPG
jgi:peroxiredoxin